MVLNYIWIAFFLIAFVVAVGKLVIGGDTAVFTEIINASFASAKTGFEISLGLTGILSLWLGIMKIGEKGGVIQAFARLAAPVFSKLFPDIYACYRCLHLFDIYTVIVTLVMQQAGHITSVKAHGYPFRSGCLLLVAAVVFYQFQDFFLSVVLHIASAPSSLQSIGRELLRSEYTWLTCTSAL